MPQYTQEALNKIAIEAMIEKRNRLQSEVNQLDKAIKELKVAGQIVTIDKVLDKLTNESSNGNSPLPNGVIPSKLQVRKVILDIFDKFNRPLKMNDIQEEYTKITGVDYNVRENVRSLNNQGLLKLMKINDSNRNAFWIKESWIDFTGENLRDEFKFDGFDAMFKTEDLNFS